MKGIEKFQNCKTVSFYRNTTNRNQLFQTTFHFQDFEVRHTIVVIVFEVMKL